MTDDTTIELKEDSDEDLLTTVCRYCLSSQSEDKDTIFISPCGCRTPVCVQCFMKRHEYGKKISEQCEICLQDYKLLHVFFESNTDVQEESDEEPINIDTSYAYRIHANDAPLSVLEEDDVFRDNKIQICVETIVKILLGAGGCFVVGLFLYVVFNTVFR